MSWCRRRRETIVDKNMTKTDQIFSSEHERDAAPIDVAVDARELSDEQADAIAGGWDLPLGKMTGEYMGRRRRNPLDPVV